MRRNLLAFLTSIGIIFFYAGISSACTTILATKGATKDGSVFISHSDDKGRVQFKGYPQPQIVHS
ncbi:MAG: hypothetical protein ACE5JK_07580, partial [Candidatus Omnitrophota bacterium]